MTAPDNATTAHPRTRSMESWRGRKAVLASRGETTGPRVEECAAALDWWRNRATFVKAGVSEAAAEDLADQLDQQAEADTESPAAAAL
ncbi:hypothetical protein [Mycolicibacterium sp. HK-90]|uniref:hypothetical protein n=1 Tax=Mycolicibacterium sp. HK-90 TaxID=3056937 RepID=UPI0026599AEC|nr:hypothetical protein [Mycolicibacterium sp. HK-90]WKG01386.1 hypothetical protein QU592_19150 [Mycolicibacterium sp. HK-90]